MLRNTRFFSKFSWRFALLRKRRGGGSGSSSGGGGNTLEEFPCPLFPFSFSRHCSTYPRNALTEFSEEEILLRSSVSRFCQEHVKPKVKRMDEKGEMDRDLLRLMFQQGLMGIETPVELNGAGMSFTSACIVIEELAKVDPAVSVICDVQNTLVTTALRKWGTLEQQRKYLPKLAVDWLGSFCLSEWSSGSDAFAMKTRAEDQGDHFLLNGTKAWVTNAFESELFLVMANIDFSKGYRGITAFLVERQQDGISLGRKEDKLGIRASSTCEVNLVNCKVPKNAVLGKLGEGYKIAIQTLNEGRIGIAAQMLGLAQGAFDSTMPYLMQRKQFGQPISSFQGIQFQIAQIATEIEAARLLTYNASRLKDNGKPFIKESAMAKLYASQIAEKVSSQCINMLGGVGFTKEFSTEKYFR